MLHGNSIKVLVDVVMQAGAQRKYRRA